MNELPAKYNFKEAEIKWRKYWEEKEIYKADPKSPKPKYSIVIPPPNVTGILHIGHILNNTIQDIYCRWKRMSGFEVCWVPGTDHAGISTQMMVEKDLAKSGKTKYDFTRKEFLEKIWEWKEKHGGIILEQLRKLGVSVDWSKERFTLDEGLSQAVKEVFVDLYKKGLVYKGKRIINYDPVSKTALSDDEIVYNEEKDKLYYIKYELIDFPGEFLTVATTRPETMFGDTAVAVNPEDSRYKKYINKKVRVPLVNRIVPVIADKYVDISFGTGALKITPGHDVNDYEVGANHNLEQINILDDDCKLNEVTGEFCGLDIKIGRIKTVEKLKEIGLLLKVEDYTHNVAIADRSKAVIEPLLSDQWFVNMKEMAQPALEAVNNGRIKFHPERYVKVYNHWMENIRDWCISRQLWWGHQIPIWYHNTTGEVYCETTPPEDIENWTQDPDVLDTWFSSWLWPFSVFGWENSGKDNNNELLKAFYPTDLLSTAADIIFLWVARMIMSGLEYMKDIPFKDVYFHSIIRDGKGRKMSKTLGNSPDPLVVMDKYGTDALRFTLIYLAPLGNDVLFDEEKTEIGRNFVTKIWNAGRFLLLNKTKIDSDSKYSNEKIQDDIADKWIESRLNSTLKEIKVNLLEFKLNEYTKSLYNFIWNDFCDWYIEILKSKIDLNEKSAVNIINRAIELYEKIIKLVHPAMPYMSEEIWHLLKDGREDLSISNREFPILDEELIKPEAETEFEIFKELVTGIRNLKTDNNSGKKRDVKIIIKFNSDTTLNFLRTFEEYIKKLAGIGELQFLPDVPENKDKYASKILTGIEIYLYLEDVEIDEKQKNKYISDLKNLENYLIALEKKLSNQNFLQKASEQVINAEKQKKSDTLEKIAKLREITGIK